MVSLVCTVLVLVACGVKAETDVSLSSLGEELRSLKRGLELSETRNRQLTNTVHTLQARLTKVEHSRVQRQLLVDAHPEVGFMATATANEHNLHMNQEIIYDHVITNIGNAYDAKTGQFHCSISGTYLFNFNVMADDSDYVEASLMVNGNHIVHALSDHGGSSTSWDMGTTNVIIQLREGDVVSVGIQNGSWSANTIHGNSFNTFSGYLLRASQGGTLV